MFRLAFVMALPAIVLSQVTAVPTVAPLTWFAGCWQGASTTASYEEQWMKPAGGMLLGMSRTVRNGRVVAHEFLRIAERDGKIFYDANPSGQTPASFALTRISATEAVFEDLTHDFPQRIIYRKTATGLDARVESADSKKGQDFPMRAAACN